MFAHSLEAFVTGEGGVSHGQIHGRWEQSPAICYVLCDVVSGTLIWTTLTLVSQTDMNQHQNSQESWNHAWCPTTPYGVRT